MINERYKYRLTLGDTLWAQADPLGLIEGVPLPLKVEDTKYRLRLLSVKVSRKIYEPCRIEAELVFTQPKSETEEKDSLEDDLSNKGNRSTTLQDKTKAPQFDDVTKLLLQRYVKLELLKVKVEDDKIKGFGEAFTIGEDYYVYEVNPQLKRNQNGTMMYVKLNIFSIDKLMALNKYSKVYVAQKLGSTILKTESKHFGKRLDNETPFVKTNTSGIRYLKYIDRYTFAPSNLKAEIPSEFIQPYLVQYNETFYDFLVRTANRCGEFLFFENGELVLGLPDSGDPLEIEDFDSVTKKYISSDAINVGNYTRDSMKSDPDKVNDYNHEVDEREDTGYPKDIFPDDYMTNAELANDEYLFPLFKDKFSDTKREMQCDGDIDQSVMAQLFPFFGDLLANEGDGVKGLLVSMGKSFVVGKVLKTGLAWKQQGARNSAKAKHHITPYKNLTEQCNDNKVVQFGTLNKQGWTTINYYNDIHKYESELQKQTICIDMGTNVAEVKLGQKIRVKGISTTYIVIEIEQTSEEVRQRDYDLYNQHESSKASGARSMKIYAIPAQVDANREEKYYPPVQPVPIIRKAGPQTAFVTDNDDPKYQGRVRIAYPWQALKSKMKEKLAVEESHLKKDQEDLEKIKKKQEELSKQLILLSTTLDEVENLRASSNWVTFLNEREEEVKRLEQQVAEAQKEIDSDAKSNSIFIDVKKATLADLQARLQKKKFILGWLRKTKEEIKERRRIHIQGKPKEEQVVKNLHAEIHERHEEYIKIKLKINTSQRNIALQEKSVNAAKTSVEEEIKQMSSPWVRIATSMATPGGGTYFKPRVGDEVLVNYDNDNVERPYVVGSLYSKNAITPDEIYYRKMAPDIQSKDISMAITSPNGHHITFTDPPKGSNFLTNVISPGLGLYGTMVPPFGDNFKDLAGGIHIGDGYGMYEMEMNSHKRSIDIKSPFGTVSIEAFSGITISAPNGDVTIKGKNITLEAGNKIDMLSGKNIADPGLGGGASVADMLNDAAGAVAASVVDIFGTSVVDFSLIRYVVEVFVRPVDGTMCLKSKRYLKLEAGKGNATIRRDRYAEKITDDSSKSELFFIELGKAINFISDRVNSFYNEYEQYWKAAHEKYISYHQEAASCLKDPFDPCLCVTVENESEWSNTDLRPTFSGKLKDEHESRRAKFLQESDLIGLAEDYLKACFEIKKYRSSCLEYVLEYKPAVKNEASDCFEIAMNTSRGPSQDLITKMTFNTQFEKNMFTDSLPPEEDVFSKKNKTIIKRKLILSFLKKVNDANMNEKGQFISAGYDLDRVFKDKSLSKEYYWKRQVRYLEKSGKLQNPFLRMLWDNSVNRVFDKLKSNFAPFDRDIWRDKVEGQILFSDQEGTTLNFDGTAVHSETDANIGTLDYLKKLLMGIE